MIESVSQSYAIASGSVQQSEQDIIDSMKGQKDDDIDANLRKI